MVSIIAIVFQVLSIIHGHGPTAPACEHYAAMCGDVAPTHSSI
jgi:hypothetical protein